MRTPGTGTTATASARPPQRDRNTDARDLEQWTAMAAKLTADDDLVKETEKKLFEESLAALRKVAEDLEDTRWLYEEMPTPPEKIQSSAGL